MRKKLTIEGFVEKARKIHGEKYDYSKVNYINSQTKVCIICPIHGEFWQRPNDHLSGKGCQKCAGNTASTTVSFIEKAKKIHGDKYDYSKVDYVSAFKRVCIICPQHGEFLQTPDNHIHGKGCPKCAGKHLTTDEIIEKFKKTHAEKYDYSKVIYEKMNKPVCIICSKHGEFLQLPSVHISGCGCPKCANERAAYYQRLGLKNFINRAKQIHHNKYDYSKVEYVNNETKVCIICPKHGEFWQLPYDHLCGKGCFKCAHEKIGEIKSLKYDDFVERANELHMSKYFYDKDTYTNASNKMRMICPIHGEFWQDPSHHLGGNGCPNCNESKLEMDVARLLSDKQLQFDRKKRFNWLGAQHLDFYIPEFNAAIECQGEQHYKPTNFGSKTRTSEECFKAIVERDTRKSKLCNENNVRLLYFSDKKYESGVITNKEELFEKIKNV